MGENQNSSQLEAKISAKISANLNGIVKGASKIAKDFVMVSIGTSLLLLIFFFGEWLTGREMLSIFIVNMIVVFFVLFGIGILIARLMEEKERTRCISLSR